ncbi:MAG: lysylphosphatidylglycerol synthase transmembrane domain-containing protein [Actinomycetota bacterium]
MAATTASNAGDERTRDLAPRDDPVGPRARQRTWQTFLVAGLVVAVYGAVLPRIASYGEVWQRVGGIRTRGAALLVAAALWNLVTYWFLLMAALPGLSLREAAISNQASTAVSNVVPGGGAWGVGVTWTMYRQWGFSREASARALLLTSVWNNFVKLGTPLVAFGLSGLIGGDGDAPRALGLVSLSVLTVSLALLIGSLRSRAVARRLGSALGQVASAIRRPFGREPVLDWAERGERMRIDAAALVGRRWGVLTLAAIVSHLALFLVLLTSVRQIGIPAADVTWLETLTAFALVRVALLIPVTPGGAGLAELGLAGALVAAGGQHPEVVAAVLLFRALTWLLPILLGGLAYLLWLWEVPSSRRRACSDGA